MFFISRSCFFGIGWVSHKSRLRAAFPLHVYTVNPTYRLYNGARTETIFFCTCARGIQMFLRHWVSAHLFPNASHSVRCVSVFLQECRQESMEHAMLRLAFGVPSLHQNPIRTGDQGKYVCPCTNLASCKPQLKTYIMHEKKKYMYSVSI